MSSQARYVQQFIVTLQSDQPLPNLIDTVSQRMWSIDHLTGNHVGVFVPHPGYEQPHIELLSTADEPRPRGMGLMSTAEREKLKEAHVDGMEVTEVFATGLVLDGNVVDPHAYGGVMNYGGTLDQLVESDEVIAEGAIAEIGFSREVPRRTLNQRAPGINITPEVWAALDHEEQTRIAALLVSRRELNLDGLAL